MDPQLQDETLSAWLGRHQGLLLKVSRSFAVDSHDRDDLLQEIAFQVWKSIPAFSKVAAESIAESTWIYRVAFHTAINWTRKESRRQELHRDSAMEEPLVDPSDDSRVEWLYEQIAQLEPIDRSLTLMMLEGFSYRDMSETLGLSESNVGVRLNRIKKHLSETLTRENDHEL